ncbi:MULTISPECIES: type III secretion effector protein [Pseudomonas fluorescens group]|uniref:type III secretion effector protein n=1 Tax=Pseudomonas fluorescens group TaxID=136843 RepID=UPI0019101533|nr:MULTISPECIES: type III secretion effector protein [Pseudomonas fluorescens group]
MSVPMLDPSPVSTSSTSDPSQANATARSEVRTTRAAPAAPLFNGQSAANVSFQSAESKAGPVFGNHQSTTTGADVSGYRHHHYHHHHHAPAMQDFMNQFKQWMSQWFTGHRPHPYPGCGGPPPRPNPGCGGPPPRPDPTEGGRPYPVAPGRPDPQYSLKNNEELAEQLRDNFHAFRDPRNPGYISVDSILAMARRGWSPNPAMRENIRLANELLRRPELMAALDRHTSTGALDNLIDFQNVIAVIKGENYFKYKTDKELAAEMLEHFDELKGWPWGPDLRIRDLKNLARQPFTGDAEKDHLIQLAQAVIKRSNLLKLMDDLASTNGDGNINWRALVLLSK